MREKTRFIVNAVINSYAILFFSQNKVLGVLLIAASFVNPAAGISGILCVLLALGFVSLLGYDKQSTGMGIYSFNALLLGIGAGTFYQLNIAFFTWLVIACIIVTVLSVCLTSALAKHGLPLLSLPFIITFWLLLLAINSIYPVGLLQRNSAILNELSTAAQDKNQLTACCSLFFRSLSAVLFQNSVLSGIVIAIGLLMHSRINFSLLVIAFLTAILFNALTGTYPDGISYYHLGANMMLASGAIGSFFLVPSFRSYCCAIIVIPVIFLLINATTRVFGLYNLPVLSLPFCVITLLFLIFFRLRHSAPGLQLTPLQHYSPERNLYQFINAKDRLDDLKYFRLELPFMGTWTVSQGYNGAHTHKGEWARALDFVIKDEKGNTLVFPGDRPENFYCFGKPVLACGAGTIEEVVDHIDDNEIGQVDTINNWGNTVIIKHLDGLYSKVSHLKKNSIKVKPGDHVKTGNVLGLCGNSGRSPEPHLHFQVQTTAYIGSKTLAYPFAYYFERADGHHTLHNFKVPEAENEICPVGISTSVKQAFNFMPGYTASICAPGKEPEVFEVFTDSLNQSYFYSKNTGATAYFINNGTSFYFTSFYGSRNSLLYGFYLSAYKVIFTDDSGVVTNDNFPLQLKTGKAVLWLQDFLSPFYRFMQLKYKSFCRTEGRESIIHSVQIQEIFGRDRQIMTAAIHVEGNSLSTILLDMEGIKTELTWSIKDTF